MKHLWLKNGATEPLRLVEWDGGNSRGDVFVALGLDPADPEFTYEDGPAGSLLVNDWTIPLGAVVAPGEASTATPIVSRGYLEGHGRILFTGDALS